MDASAYTALANRIRYDILRITHRAGSGHPTSSFSAVELVTLLMFKYLRLDLDDPNDNANDKLIISKGHASALLYSLYAAAGVIKEQELLTYRDFQSKLEGHPTKRFPLAEAATGSLGQGLAIGAGEAWGVLREMPGSPSRIYVLMGDGECAEGSVWEAAAWASFHKLYNLVAIIDVNRFGQSQESMYAYDTNVFRKRFEAFGWGTIVIDGHDWAQIDAAYQKAIDFRGGPTVIIAKTVKGKGVPYWEDKNGWHNKMLPPEEVEKALSKYKPNGKQVVGNVKKPDVFVHLEAPHVLPVLPKPPLYEGMVPTKKAFGNAIERFGATYPNLMVLDGDVANSLHTDQFRKKFPDRFLQMYIAEQNMAGAAVGLAKRGYMPMVTTFGSFMSRMHDQIRMMPLSGVTVLFNGCYVGVSLGKDGPSQMGLEDLALFRSVYGSTVLYPSDPYQTEYLVGEMLKAKGVVYIRTTREATPVIYGPDDLFPVGGSVVHTSKGSASVAIVAAGITLHEAQAAQQELVKEGVAVSVIDCYSVKPIDVATLKKAAEETSALIVVEDHFPEGGLGEAVLSALAPYALGKPIFHLAVRREAMSGTAEELMDYEGIARADIVETVKSFLTL